MAIFKCKMCGATLDIKKDENIVECEYCGTKQTVPVIKTKEIEELYDRANYFFHNNEYDKAADIYENISTENPYDPESYFMLALCKYGIEYVDDPVSRKKVPTLHKLHYESISNDVNFKKALKHADSSQKILYEQEAKYIDEVRNKILDISKKEKPYDVFICYKETDEKGQRTEDSVLAMDIYNELTKEGLKVFFARKTLESKLGIDYEPYIFAALNSAKVMIVVGTKPEYINSPWVRNEWTRFLDRIYQNKSSKKSANQCYIVPAYKSMSPYALPNEFNSVQAQDMSKIGAIQDLVDGIKKLLNKTCEVDKTEVKQNKKTGKIVMLGLTASILLLFITVAVIVNSMNRKVVVKGTEYIKNEEYDSIILQGITGFDENEISQLKKIKSIKVLYFKECTLKNLDFLYEFNNVKGVQFDATTKVSDKNLEKPCENIETFIIDSNSKGNWKSLDTLVKMPNIKEIKIPIVNDLSSLSNHNKLVNAQLYYTNASGALPINSFSWCKGLDNLKYLSITGKDMYTFVRNKTTSINSNENIIFDGKPFISNYSFFNGIENLKSIEEIYISGKIADNAYMHKDGGMSAGSNGVNGESLIQEDIEYLSKLSNLKKLTISLNELSRSSADDNARNVLDLSALQKNNKLESLKIFFGNKYDISKLAECTELIEISLSGQIISDNLSGLNKLDKLESLTFMTLSKKVSLKGIENFKNIKHLVVKRNGNGDVLDEELAKNKPGLIYEKKYDYEK